MTARRAYDAHLIAMKGGFSLYLSIVSSPAWRSGSSPRSDRSRHDRNAHDPIDQIARAVTRGKMRG
jgi:hypothetical protein